MVRIRDTEYMVQDYVMQDSGYRMQYSGFRIQDTLYNTG